MRLTNWTRESIRAAAIKAAFAPREAELATIEDALTREAYAAVFSADEIKKANALPPNWLRHDACLNFNVNGLRIELCTMQNHLRVPYRTKGSSGYSCHSEIGVILAGDLADRITAHATAKDDLRTQKRDADRKLEAMLSKIATVKKLADAWPEGNPFYEKYLEQKAPLPPAIRVEEINAALGLVAAEVEAAL